MSRRATLRAPGPDDPLRRVESVARDLDRLGARIHLQPTVAHRSLNGPVLLTMAATVVSCLVGLLLPLPAAAMLLGLAWSALRDSDGGRGWFRRLMPRRGGWLVEAELPNQLPDTAPTLIVWAPACTYPPGPFADPSIGRAALALPVGAGAMAAFCLALTAVFDLPQLRYAVVGCAVFLGLTTLATAVVLLTRRPIPVEQDPATQVPVLARRLLMKPLEGVRVLMVVGSEGASWFDDLDVFLANRRNRYPLGRTLLVALHPAAGPLTVVRTEGLVLARPAAPHLVAALNAAGLTSSEGRTGALRARARGLPAIGLRGALHEAHDPVDLALRSLAAMVKPEPT